MRSRADNAMGGDKRDSAMGGKHSPRSEKKGRARPRVRHPRCPNGGKIGYGSRKIALEAAHRFFREEPDHRQDRPNQPYKCRACHEWHLTSQDPKPRGRRDQLEGDG